VLWRKRGIWAEVEFVVEEAIVVDRLLEKRLKRRVRPAREDVGGYSASVQDIVVLCGCDIAVEEFLGRKSPPLAYSSKFTKLMGLWFNLLQEGRTMQSNYAPNAKVMESTCKIRMRHLDLGFRFMTA